MYTDFMKKLILFLLSLLPLFSQAQLTNNIVTGERNPPTISTVTVTAASPNTLVVQLLDASSLKNQSPANSAWTLSSTANAPTITSQVVDVTAKTVTLILDENILSDDAPTLSYTNPGVATGIQDKFGNELKTVSSFTVTNNVANLPVFSGNSNLLWLYNSLGLSGTTVEDKSGNNLDGTLVKSHCLNATTSTVLTFSSLSGITVSSYEGTATVAKSGNTITCSVAGTLYHIVLSNGTIIPCAEGAGTTAYDAVNSLNATLSGTYDWNSTQDTYHYNILNGCTQVGNGASSYYVAFTSNITLSGVFHISMRFKTANAASSYDLLGVTTTTHSILLSSTQVTCRFNSGTTIAANHGGYTANTWQVLDISRDGLNNFSIKWNGTEISNTVESNSGVFSRLAWSGAAGNASAMDWDYFYIYDNVGNIATQYVPENNFNGTYNGGFANLKYPKAVGGDATKRNPSGNWHNGCETVTKPNPSNNASITTAKGWTSSTELTYAQLRTVTNPAFCNGTNLKRVKDLVVYNTTLPYEDELVANNFVGKTTININKISGWSTTKHLDATVGSSYNLNSTGCTIKIVVVPSFITTSQVIFGKSTAVNGTGWLVQDFANASGSELSLTFRDGSGAVVHSQTTCFSEKEDDISIYHFVIRNGVVYTFRNGFKENTTVSFTGITTSSDPLFIGSFSGGNAFAGGIVACAFYENKGMSDAEVEASYQATKNNAYVKESGITLLFAGDAGDANQVDKVSGAVTMVKTGTLTSTSINQVFNYRWRPEDYTPDTTPLSPQLTNSSTGIKIMLVGDSRMAETYSQKFLDDYYALLIADPDIGNGIQVGYYGTSPKLHHAINGDASSDMRSGAGGNIAAHTATASPVGQPTVVVIFIGTNATVGEVSFDQEVAEYELMVKQVKDNSAAGLRFVLVEELEHQDANRRSRLQDLAHYHRTVAWVNFITKGYPCIRVDMWRDITIQGGHFSDVVHQNNSGNTIKAQKIFNATKLACGYNP